MRRWFAVTIMALLAGLAATAQIHGTPASVTSLGPHGEINGTRASVTSLGPFGYQPTPRFFFNPNVKPRLGRPVRGANRFTGGIALPYYSPFPMYPLLYPYAGVPGAYGDAYDVYGESPSGIDPRTWMVPASPASAAATSTAGSPQPAPAPVAAAPAASVAEPGPQPMTVLVFRDGHRQELRNYAIVGNALYDLTNGARRKISLNDLDLPATSRANEERGGDFALPVNPGS